MLIDLDNTILSREDGVVTPKLKEWFEKIERSGISICLVSNNWKTRVTRIADELRIPLVARAVKPSKSAFIKGMERIGTDARETAVVGDQIFTDIFGGNRLDLYTILVVPISSKDLFHTKILRLVERQIMDRFHREV